MTQLLARGFRPAYAVPVAETRSAIPQMTAAFAGARTEVGAVADRVIPGPGGDLPVRVYRPPVPTKLPLPALLYFHGGGFILGDLESHDHVCRFLCRAAGIAVIAVDYRLAPENKFPAAVEDCYAALCWAVDHAPELQIDPSRIALAGDSAGGTLVVTTCLLARERNGPRVALQVPVCAALTMADDDQYLSRRALGGGEYFVAYEDIAFFRSMYLGDPETQARLPLVSPIYADHYRDLPPALVIAAGFDPLRDEDERYAQRLKADRVPVTYRCFEGTIHPFLLFDGVLDAGRQGQQLIADTLKEVLLGGE